MKKQNHLLINISYFWVYLFTMSVLMMVPSCWSKQERNLPQVVGHRGAAGLMPENTLTGFEEALRLGVDALELDVRLTKDGQVIVHHDSCLNKFMTCDPEGQRITNNTRLISDFSYDEIQQYTVGTLDRDSLYAQRYPLQKPVSGEKIPLLKEILFLAKETNTPVYIEMKTDINEGVNQLLSKEEVLHFAKAVADVIHECKAIDQVIVMSFDWRAPIFVKHFSPEVRTSFVTMEKGYRDDTVWRKRAESSPWLAGYKVQDFGGSIPRMIKAAGGQGWNTYHQDLSKKDIMEAQALGLKVVVWTPDTEREMNKMINLGVDGITTNRPDLLLNLLKG